jgi:hypothetical protein
MVSNEQNHERSRENIRLDGNQSNSIRPSDQQYGVEKSVNSSDKSFLEHAGS